MTINEPFRMYLRGCGLWEVCRGLVKFRVELGTIWGCKRIEAVHTRSYVPFSSQSYSSKQAGTGLRRPIDGQAALLLFSR